MSTEELYDDSSVDKDLEEMRAAEISESDNSEENAVGEESAPEAEPQKEEDREDTVEDSTSDSDKEEKQKFVPYGALHEERMRRKEADERAARMEERFAQILERMAPKEEPKQEPNYYEDTEAYLNNLEKKIKATEDFQKQAVEQAEQRQQREQFNQHIAFDEAEFAKKTPDYYDAFEYIRSQREQQLRAFGVSDKREIDQFVAADAFELVQRALKNGMSPSEAVYNAAVNSGYKKKSDKPIELPAEEKIKIQQKREDAGKSLSGISGSQHGKPTLEHLSGLSDEEFANVSDEDFRAVLGG